MGHSFYHHIWVHFQLLFFNSSCNTWFVLGSVMNSNFLMLSATFFWCFALVCQVVDFDYHDCIYTFVLHLYNSLRIAVAYQDWDDSMLSRRTICLVRRCTAFPFLFYCTIMHQLQYVSIQLALLSLQLHYPPPMNSHRPFCLLRLHLLLYQLYQKLDVFITSTQSLQH